MTPDGYPMISGKYVYPRQKYYIKHRHIPNSLPMIYIFYPMLRFPDGVKIRQSALLLVNAISNIIFICSYVQFLYLQYLKYSKLDTFEMTNKTIRNTNIYLRRESNWKKNIWYYGWMENLK